MAAGDEHAHGGARVGGALPAARVARLAPRRGRTGVEGGPAHEGPLPELAEQPDRRRAHPRRPRAHRGSGSRARPVGDLRRVLRGRALRRRRAREHRLAARHVRAHGAGVHVQQDVRGNRRARRVPGGPRRARSGTACRRSSSSPRATSRPSRSTAAIGALEGSQDVVDAYRSELQARRDLFYAGIRDAAGHVFSGEPPAGAFYAFLRIDPSWAPPDGASTASRSWAMAEHLIGRGRIGCVPGVDFGPTGEGYVRFCFARDRDELLGALGEMRALFAEASASSVDRSQ